MMRKVKANWERKLSRSLSHIMELGIIVMRNLKFTSMFTLFCLLKVCRNLLTLRHCTEECLKAYFSCNSPNPDSILCMQVILFLYLQSSWPFSTPHFDSQSWKTVWNQENDSKCWRNIIAPSFLHLWSYCYHCHFLTREWKGKLHTTTKNWVVLA